jgi:parallel beta-helix repeat protein
VQITRSIQVEAVNTYPYARYDYPPCDWYVDGILGGNAMTGTVTQANPATYTAPPAVPPGGAVGITAVSRENSAFSASDSLRIAFTVRYVDGDDGNDTSSGGAWTNPLRTLTYALDAVTDGDTLCVLPGSYDPDHGEAGNFFIPGGVTVAGTSRDSCLVSGSGTDYSVVRLGDGATIEGVTIVNWNEDDFAILTTGGGLIRNVAARGPFDVAVVRADGGRGARTSDVVIEDCEFTNTSSPRTGRALELYYGTRCVVRGCTVSGWEYGLYINRDSDPLIERCTITDNAYGIIAAGGGGLLTQPDLGGGARGSVGGNAVRDNVNVGVFNMTAADIWALDNTWTTDPPTEGAPPPATDFWNPGGGTVIWTR